MLQKGVLRWQAANGNMFTVDKRIIGSCESKERRSLALQAPTSARALLFAEMIVLLCAVRCVCVCVFVLVPSTCVFVVLLFRQTCAQQSNISWKARSSRFETRLVGAPSLSKTTTLCFSKRCVESSILTPTLLSKTLLSPPRPHRTKNEQPAHPQHPLPCRTTSQNRTVAQIVKESKEEIVIQLPEVCSSMCVCVSVCLCLCLFAHLTPHAGNFNH